VLVGPGTGVLARRDFALLFFPDAPDDASLTTVERLLREFRDGEDIDLCGDDVPPHALIRWHAGRRVDATIEVDVDHAAGTVHAGSASDRLAPLTDLAAGAIRAGGFQLQLPPAALQAPQVHDMAGAAEVEPPQFDELTGLDVTLAPIGPVTYPDDDTDRTTQQPFDVRCRNGHANSHLTTTCRICGEIIETTARRATPRAAKALAGLELPDGRIVPVDATLVVGRDPQAIAARASDQPRLIRLDAPSTVSRTHVVFRIENRSVTVTDCDSRGRTAVVRSGADAPVALTPWDPAELTVGDAVHLGGPTSLTIVEPHVQRSTEPTERP
jgi:hypothetical protein